MKQQSHFQENISKLQYVEPLSYIMEGAESVEFGELNLYSP